MKPETNDRRQSESGFGRGRCIFFLYKEIYHAEKPLI